jgi:biopolymer transport protein ExbB/TolQ
MQSGHITWGVWHFWVIVAIFALFIFGWMIYLLGLHSWRIIYDLDSYEAQFDKWCGETEHLINLTSASAHRDVLLKKLADVDIQFQQEMADIAKAEADREAAENERKEREEVEKQEAERANLEEAERAECEAAMRNQPSA